MSVFCHFYSDVVEDEIHVLLHCSGTDPDSRGGGRCKFVGPPDFFLEFKCKKVIFVVSADK